MLGTFIFWVNSELFHVGLMAPAPGPRGVADVALLNKPHSKIELVSFNVHDIRFIFNVINKTLYEKQGHADKTKYIKTLYQCEIPQKRKF